MEWQTFNADGPLEIVTGDNLDQARNVYKIKNPEVKGWQILPMLDYEHELHRQQTVLESQIEQLSYHEAGHAVIGNSFGFKIILISMRPVPFFANGRFDPLGKGSLAITKFDFGPFNMDTRNQFLEHKLAMIFAGLSAEIRYSGHDANREWWKENLGDAWASFEIMRMIYGVRHNIDDYDPDAFSIRKITNELLDLHWPSVEAVARKLIVNRYMSGEEFLQQVNPCA